MKGYNRVHVYKYTSKEAKACQLAKPAPGYPHNPSGKKCGMNGLGFGYCVMPMGTSYCPAMHWGTLGLCSAVLPSPPAARLLMNPHCLAPLPVSQSVLHGEGSRSPPQVQRPMYKPADKLDTKNLTSFNQTFDSNSASFA